MAGTHITLPTSFRKLECHTLSTDFRNATDIVECPIPECGPKDVLVKLTHAGINASDINFTAGRYAPGVNPPFDVGFEGVGTVAAIGKDVRATTVGSAVGVAKNGCFTEYIVCREKELLPLPSAAPEFVPLLVSAATASVALEKVGELKGMAALMKGETIVEHRPETVLVTAAAGGTGQFAVQLAKLAGNHVIGTCSTDEKVEFLKSIGCDRPINYKKEDLGAVLRTEYTEGVDVVYESVGGTTFETCMKALKDKGRLIVIGAISGYAAGTAWKRDGKQAMSIPMMMLAKSASIRGFFLFHYSREWRGHIPRLSTLVQEKRLKSVIDMRHSNGNGLDGVKDAVDYLYSGKNVGKVVVELTKRSRL
eukprot:TRINITY_DN259_c1_g1_i3.p1 TRINITY_DN259_c1_g1~~TRINITY_DN259_c1_g1_i3.p1  ORF type:complete len:365 (-),score=87.31 TRINITY_DN259_c1_g1_i3:629-1723(-)